MAKKHGANHMYFDKTFSRVFLLDFTKNKHKMGGHSMRAMPIFQENIFFFKKGPQTLVFSTILNAIFKAFKMVYCSFSKLRWL